MAKALKVDDGYMDDMSLFFDEEGKDLDDAVNAYIRIMKDVKRLAVISGDLSLALEGFNIMAGRVSDEIRKMTETAAKKMQNYVAAIDEADQYIF